MEQRNNIAQISLTENAVFMIRDGELIKIDRPGEGFGKQIVTWQNGKPTHYEVSYTVK